MPSLFLFCEKRLKTSTICLISSVSGISGGIFRINFFALPEQTHPLILFTEPPLFLFPFRQLKHMDLQMICHTGSPLVLYKSGGVQKLSGAVFCTHLTAEKFMVLHQINGELVSALPCVRCHRFQRRDGRLSFPETDLR